MNKKTNNKRRLKMRKNSLLGKLILVTILLIIVLNILRYAAYFKKEDYSIIKVIIQNEANVELENDVYIDENNVIYFSEADIKKYFDEGLYYEKDENGSRRYFSISQSKILDITENQNLMYVNNVLNNISGKVFEKDGVYYFPISELTDVYNLEIEFLSDINTVNIEKLSEEKITAVVNREVNLKYKMTEISRNVKKLEQGETVTILEEMNDKWIRVKTSDYRVGYVKKSKLLDFQKERTELSLEKQCFKDFDLNNDVVITLDDSIYDDFETKISTYSGRTALCDIISDEIMKAILNNDLSNRNIGIKIDKSGIQNIDNYYRFLQELRVYTNSNGCFLIVVNQAGLDENYLNKISDVVI